MNESKWRKFILSEAVTTTVKDVTFDILKNTFKNKYQKLKDGVPGGRKLYDDPVAFPGATGMTYILDDVALERWKSKHTEFSNSEIILDPDSKEWFNLVQIPDIKKDYDERYKGIGDYYNKKPGQYTGD
jgi:uncharacterized protein YihD (DUF1040 family)